MATPFFTIAVGAAILLALGLELALPFIAYRLFRTPHREWWHVALAIVFIAIFLGGLPLLYFFGMLGLLLVTGGSFGA